MNPADAGIRFDAADLVPVVVQDAGDGRVLMLAYANAEALALTLGSGEVHFWSRSRGALWRKGETSGNVLRLRGLERDCDGDALLALVEPAGPTCHTGARSCFDAGGPLVEGASAGRLGFDWLETLWTTIAERAATRPEGSYTAKLLARGVDGPARKVAEEAVEVLMAAKDDAAAERGGTDRSRLRDDLTGEVADLLYHTLVLLAERGLSPEAVIRRLRERHGG